MLWDYAMPMVRKGQATEAERRETTRDEASRERDETIQHINPFHPTVPERPHRLNG